MASNVALADSILENAEPLIARDLVSLTLGSTDPDDHRRFLELMSSAGKKTALPRGPCSTSPSTWAVPSPPPPCQK